jgi:hypothetical protein
MVLHVEADAVVPDIEYVFILRAISTYFNEWSPPNSAEFCRIGEKIDQDLFYQLPVSLAWGNGPDLQVRNSFGIIGFQILPHISGKFIHIQS